MADTPRRSSVEEASIKELLKQKDAFLTTSERAYEFAANNARLLAIVLAVILAAALLVFGLMKYKAGQERDASEALENAWQLVQKSDPGALAALEAVCRNHPDSAAVRVASFKMSELYAAEGKYDEALKISEGLFKTLSAAEAPIKGLLLANLGSLYESVGDLEKAAQSFEAAQKDAGDDFKLTMQMAQARVAAARDRQDEARKIYEEIVKTHPGAEAFFMARHNLALLSEPQYVAPPAAEAMAETLAPAAEAEEAPSDDGSAAQ